MQLTDQTIKALSDEKGELKDHFINVTHKTALDPTLNIAAGIRWLFRKRETAESKMGKDISWREVIVHYKGYKNQKEPRKGMDNFDKRYGALKDYEKNKK